MDIGEHIFKYFWKKTKNSEQISSVCLNDYKDYLSCFASLVLKNASLELESSSEYTGFLGKQLYLPHKISWSSSKENNLLSYKYLILISVAVKKLNLKSQYKDVDKISELQKKIESSLKSDLILEYLKNEFPNFEYFQKKYFIKLAESFPDFEFLNENNYFPILNKKSASSRYYDDTKQLLELIYCNLQMPSYVHNVVEIDHELYQSQITSEKENKNQRISKEKKFENEKEFNPIQHSFEKTECVDDYKNGNKYDSGKDEINDHSEGLEENSMNQTTLDGENANSVYKSNIKSHYILRDKKVKTNKLYYPEWSVKQNKLIENYCGLNVISEPIDEKLNSYFVESTIKENQILINKYKKFFDNLSNVPLWHNKQSEGSEVDMDEYIRYQSDLKNSNLKSTYNLYCNKKNRTKDVQIHILFDQSLSTDSWVNNVKVLDTIKKSLIILSQVLKEYEDNISVSSTYSNSRHNCYFHEIKTGKSSWKEYLQKLSAIEAKGYTRIGPAIRHIKSKFNKLQSTKKILILITDGKPSDIDPYEGIHGIQDIHNAVYNLEKNGVLTFGVLIDSGAAKYFNQMFKKYIVLQDINEMPKFFLQLFSEFI